MHIVFEDGGRRADLEVVVHDPEATVDDLVSALGGSPDGPVLHVDGIPVEGRGRIGRVGIGEGSTVSFAASAPADPHGGGVELRIVGGLAAGAAVRLGTGRWPLGRHDDTVDLASSTVSERHAVLAVTPAGTVTIVDAGSRNGTWVDGRHAAKPLGVGPDAVVRLGATQLQVRTDEAGAADAPASLPRPGSIGTVPFNRPPRPAPAPELDPLVPPDPPEPARAASPVGVVSIVAPLVLGLVMIKLLGSLLFGLFALLTPVMVIGSAIEARRRRRTGSRRERQRFARDLGTFAADLEARAARQRQHLVDLAPDPSEVDARALAPSTRLWERRPGHPDLLHVRVGIGPVPWTPPVVGDRRRLPADVRQVLDQHRTIDDAPVVVDLAADAVVGLVGNRAAGLALARWLVTQLATHHGPADLELAAVVAPGHRTDWDWTKWLPHSRDPTTPDERLLRADPDAADELLRSLLEARALARADAAGADPPTGPEPTRLLVVDDESLTSGRRAPARSVLRGGAGPVAGIVLAASEDRLPSVVTTVVELRDADGTAELHHLPTGTRVGPFLATGVDERTARRIARALARLDDPERADQGATLPAAVGLAPLLDVDHLDPEALARRWAAAGADPALVTPLGIGEEGPLAIDLVADGPHALIAGTTGSGKSELLRTLVAGLATACAPHHVNFVLIDFKGGSAFDECRSLPHTVGLVTDLDPHLAERALRCMEAELRHRERTLRAAGAGDLTAYRRGAPAGAPPLPRLVVVIDEFATLKAELGDFVESLVNIAQRGRSLGVHLVLATQRPAGAVSDSIRANTNLRIALRVQDAADSQDVLDLPDAARIPRNRPGRALARLGPGEVLAVQTALSTGIGSSGGRRTVEVHPFGFGGCRAGQSGTAGPTTAIDDARPDRAGTDLARLVETARSAHRRSGLPPPRRPWPPPLPVEVDLEEVREHCAGGSTVAFALADDPDRQVQYPAGWDRSAGNLLFVGIPGSGTTTACGSLVLALAAEHGPDRLHVHVIDLGAGDLLPLAALPQVGSVVLSGQRERQARLLGWLRKDLDGRRGAPAGDRPAIVVVLDGLGGLRAEWEDGASEVLDHFQQVFTEGPELGVHTVVTADRLGAVPASVQGVVRQRWLFRLADRHDFAGAGIRPAAVPDLPPGGAIVAEHQRQVQVARPADGLPAAVARIAAGSASAGLDRAGVGPVAIDELPCHVPLGLVIGAARSGEVPWFVPFAIDDADRAPAGFTLHPGGHALVAGPSRSGRSTTLTSIAAVLQASAPTTRLVVLADARSPLSRCPAADLVVDPADGSSGLAALGSGRLPTMLLVDDADLVADDDGALAALLATRHDHLHVVAAGRNEALRALFVHWTRTVRLGRSILLLQPDLDLDGDLAGVTLPRRSPVPPAPGRGYLVEDGTVRLVQVATGLA